jgi:hypothetical protein
MEKTRLKIKLNDKTITIIILLIMALLFSIAISTIQHFLFQKNYEEGCDLGKYVNCSIRSFYTNDSDITDGDEFDVITLNIKNNKGRRILNTYVKIENCTNSPHSQNILNDYWNLWDGSSKEYKIICSGAKISKGYFYSDIKYIYQTVDKGRYSQYYEKGNITITNITKASNIGAYKIHYANENVLER